jgi:hypothetical protein
MGIDITMVAERRRPEGTWERAEPFVTSRPPMTAFGPIDGPPLVRLRVYSGRNYALYDALVWGVAVGREGSEEERYVVEPAARIRGMPADASEETLAEHADNTDAYGVSWVTAAELAAFDWDQEVLEKATRCMWLAPGGEVRGWRTVGVRPEGDGWAEAGGRYSTRFGAVLQDFVRPVSRTYREACEHFLAATLPTLLSFGPPDEVRVVFWFS